MKSRNQPVGEKFTVELGEVGINDVALVGGKNASLGEMIRTLQPKGIRVPDGFAVTSYAYWNFIHSNKLAEPIRQVLDKLDRDNYSNLETISDTLRELILESKLPDETIHEVKKSYQKLCEKFGPFCDVAVRSSATAEDLPGASFAGQHESYLNIRGAHQVLNAVLHCYASLFTKRAIKYRIDQGYDKEKIALSVGIQAMVRSDIGCSGVCFTLEPESGFRDIIHIAGTWGLGENIVQGNVTPDEFYVFKPTFIEGRNGIINKKLGAKQMTMVYAEHTDHEISRTTVNLNTSPEKQKELVLSDEEINLLAQWALIIEKHYNQAMDIEWAKDGNSGELFIVQARPETAHSVKKGTLFRMFELKVRGEQLAQGIAVGTSIASGKARRLSTPSEAAMLQRGEILIAESTSPDWDPILKKAAAIITEKGGRTSHASIVARELGVPAIVGAVNASRNIKDGELITVSCAEGKTGFVYKGKLSWKESEIDLGKMVMPKTQPMLILGDPEKAFKYSFYPNQGIGLLRLEFIITNSIKVHPMALVNFGSLKDKNAEKEIQQLSFQYQDKKDYFIEKLSEAVAVIAAAFYPKDVIVRMSDFKTNEYANLLGGKEFEPEEENPMIGFRGASRYYDDRYREGFRLECAAMKRVREELGFTNVKLMIPFCRTVEEASKVIQQMEAFGLKRKENGLEMYMMAEIPSNVLLAEEFANYFDGFSIGSNDLTQLTLGIDRDSTIISGLFDEKNAAAKKMIEMVIRSAKKTGTKIGLCGQAPSDFPEYADFLVRCGIDSISFNPDALLKGIENIAKAENALAARN